MRFSVISTLLIYNFYTEAFNCPNSDLKLMSTSFDPFGTALLDYISGIKDQQIEVETNLTENETIPVPYLFRTWEEMPEKEQFALSLAKGKILDVGAGAGSHALALQNLKKEVTALDWSENCCKVMEKRGVAQILQEDFFKIDENTKYDSLLFLMNGFGIVGKLERLDLFFQKCKSLLSPGGIVIGESVDILYMFEDEEEEGAYLIDINGDYYGELNYRMSYKDIKGEWFPWLYVSSDHVIEAAERNGFKMIDFFEGEDSDYIICLELQ